MTAFELGGISKIDHYKSSKGGSFKISNIDTNKVVTAKFERIKEADSLLLSGTLYNQNDRKTAGTIKISSDTATYTNVSQAVSSNGSFNILLKRGEAYTILSTNSAYLSVVSTLTSDQTVGNTVKIEVKFTQPLLNGKSVTLSDGTEVAGEETGRAWDYSMLHEGIIDSYPGTASVGQYSLLPSAAATGDFMITTMVSKVGLTIDIAPAVGFYFGDGVDEYYATLILNPDKTSQSKLRFVKISTWDSNYSVASFNEFGADICDSGSVKISLIRKISGLVNKYYFYVNDNLFAEFSKPSFDLGEVAVGFGIYGCDARFTYNDQSFTTDSAVIDEYLADENI